jgi:putative phosphoribosyl transferase
MVSGWKLEDAGIDQEITMAGIKQLERRELEVKIPAAGVFLTGNLMMPVTPRGVVLFAHGSGSSRFSPRNRFVAGILLEAGFAALLMDLLTTKEEAIDLQTRQLRFDIRLLAGRLFEAIDWLGKNPATAGLVVGCFGASTGAAAALIAAAERPAVVRAVVSRGGRPDLAGEALRQVKAPTLLIVGGDDHVVIELNRQALAQLAGEKQLEIVPGATHLFEEPGTLEAAARLTSNWFGKHL